MRRLAHLVAAMVALFAVAPHVSAATAPSGAALAGLWNRDDGLGGVRIAPCGDALCGDVVWLKNPSGPAHIGERLLYGLHKTSEGTWTGSAVNPEDNGTYAGTVLLDGDHVKMRGCAMLGLICQTVGLSRVSGHTPEAKE